MRCPKTQANITILIGIIIVMFFKHINIRDYIGYSKQLLKELTLSKEIYESEIKDMHSMCNISTIHTGPFIQCTVCFH